MYTVQKSIGGKKMTLSSKKMKNYSLIRISTVCVLIVALVTSTFSIPFIPGAVAEPLTPPDKPSNPDPANGSTDVSVSADLGWTCSDPDGDPLTFDVYFGTVSPPPKLLSNISDTMYNPGTMSYSTKYYWYIIAWDNHSEFTIGEPWEFTTEVKVNNPPNKPSILVPSNGSTNILLTQILSWTGGDPDAGDVVKYDVFFGTSTTPAKVSTNQTGTSYDPISVGYNTKYYWRIIAWDNYNASSVGDLWQFTTIQGGALAVTIVKPIQGMFYFNDAGKLTLSGNNTIVYGKITIIANVTASSDIKYIEFRVDGKLIENLTENLSGGSFTVVWQPIIQFNSAISLKRTITVVAYDSEGNNASANITITKWRFHPLPWILAGIALASRLVLHTTVVGIFFNVRESRFSVSFYAIRAHYKTIGLVQSRRGVVNFKHCTGGTMIGPTTLTKFGLFHKFAIGSFTFIGGLNDQKLGLGGSLLSGLLQSRSSDRGGLFGGLRNLRS